MFAPDGKRLMVAGSDTGAVIGEAPWPITRQSAKQLPGLEVAGGSLTPSVWSRDGRWLSGSILDASGELSGFAVYNVATGRVRRLNRDSHFFELAWLPGNRRVVYFTDRGTLVMQDIETLERREISGALPYPPAVLGNIVASPDGKTLYYGAQQSQANIWLVKPSANGVTR
jgi:Tol biopolymer transport system component